MKFKRISSSTKPFDYPDFEPGDIIKLRGRKSSLHGMRKEDDHVVLKQVIKSTKSGRRRKTPKNYRMVYTLSYSSISKSSFINRILTYYIKDYYKGNE